MHARWMGWVRGVASGFFLLAALVMSASAFAQVGETKEFDVAPQPLETALRQVAETHQLQISFDARELKGLSTAGLKGRYSVREAVERLLEGTGVAATFNERGAVAIRKLVIEKGGQAANPTLLAQAPSAERRGTSPSQDRPTSSDQQAVRGEGIIVTATKREERLQDIPMSVAVITNQDIERRGLIGMEDYLRSIPGVNQVDRGGVDNAIVIRGITTSLEFENSTAGITVASYFDETPITGAAGPGAGGVDVRPVDMERIEILRGPQGTTFGNSSLGGAVRLIPAKPKLDGFEGKVVTSYSGTAGHGSDNTMAQGVLNIPVVKDMFALRLVGYRYDESGFYRNIAGTDAATIALFDNFGLGDFVRGHVQDDVGRMVSTGGRLAALWQPTGSLKLSLNFLSQKIEQNGNPYATIGRYEQANPPLTPQARVRGETGEASDTKIDLVNLVLNYDLGWGMLTSAVSRVDGGFAKALDLSKLIARPLSDIQPNTTFRSFTSETRLASQLAGRFQFLAGLYYEDVDDDFLEITYWPGTPATNPFPLRTNPTSIAERTRKLDQHAVFGEASYDLTDKVTATVGGRYFQYEKNERVLREGSLFGVSLGAGIAQALKSSEDGSTFKANLSYKPTRDSLMYASWAQGFRLGRPDAGAIPAVCDRDGDGLIDGSSISIESTRRINSDFAENYEIGGKLTLLDRRMVVDAAIYHIKWDGLPFRAVTSTCPSFIANAGAATSSGVEFQTSLFFQKSLRLDFGAGYTQAKLSNDAPGLPGSPRAGARLPGSPQWSANLAVQYDFNVAGHKAFVRADSFYTGTFYGDLLETPGLRAGGYVKVDTRAGLALNKNLVVEFFVRNLTNEDAFTWRGPGGLLSGAANPFFGYRLRPRTVGIQLGYNFK